MSYAKTFSFIPHYCGRGVIFLVRCLLWLAAGLLVLGVAFLLVLRLYVVPHLSDWRPDIERALSRHLALDVQIASIDVGSSAMLPDISLSQLQIRDLEKHETQLLIPYAQVRFSFGALLRLGAAEILVRDMELSVQRQGPTQWTVAGFLVDTTKPGNPYVSDRVLANRSVYIQNASLHYFDKKAGTEWTLQDVQFSMRNTRSQHHFGLAMVLPAGEKPIQIQGDFNNKPLALHPSDWTQWSGNLHVNASQLDLAAVNKRLGWFTKPFEEASLGIVADIQIKQGKWQSAKGQLSQLTYRPNAKADSESKNVSEEAKKASQIPGIGNANIDFEVTPQQGEAKLDLNQGWVFLPGFLAEAKVPLDTLKAKIEWKQEQESLSVKASQIELKNTDLALQGMVEWEGGIPESEAQNKPESSIPDSRINVAVELAQAQANRVYRYLPLGISKGVRQYLQAALTKGQLENTSIQIQGPLAKIPFTNDNKGKGVFRIAGKMRDVRFVYIPPYLQEAGSKAWPVLEQASATWSLDGSNLQVSDVRARLENTDIQPVLLDMSIPNMYEPVLSVNFKTQAALPKVLTVIRQSALADVLGSELLQSMRASGDARYQFSLKTPLNSPKNTELRGQITLLGNDIKINADIPWIRKLKGNLIVSEQGFSITQAQAQVVGGPVQFQAELAPATKGAKNRANQKTKSPLVFQASGRGRLTTEGLSEASELGMLSKASQYMSGSTDYDLNIRVEQGRLPEFKFSTDLRGITSTLPEPFAKVDDARMPLLFEVGPVTAAQRTSVANAFGTSPPTLLDHMELRLGEKGQVAHVRYTRDWSSGVARALQGSIAIGLDETEAPPASDQGVGAHIDIKQIDANVWLEVWNSLQSSPVDVVKEQGDPPLKFKGEIQAQGLKQPSQEQSKKEQSASQQAALSFLPDVLVLRTGLFRFGPYSLTDLVVGGQRSQNNWTATLSAAEAAGFVRYDQADATSPASIYARLPYLYLKQKDTSDVKQRIQEGPTSLPNIDLVINDLRLDKRDLGELAFKAQNTVDSPPEILSAYADQNKALANPNKENNLWEIQNLSLTIPETTLKVKGSWRFMPKSAQAVQTDKGRTSILFELETSNLGGLLNRLDLPDTVSKGNGKFSGDLTWAGSPLQVNNYAGLDGSVQVDLRQGSLLQIEPGTVRLLGLFSLQFLPRLFTSNAESTLGTGFAFDEIDGKLVLNKGVAQTQQLEIRNSELANVSINGRINLVEQTQNLQVVVAPKVDFSGAALAASAINPALLILLPVQWIASKLIEGSNIKLFQVTGSWSKPVITEENVPPPEESKPQQ